MEVQLRTKRMDDVDEIGAANHRVYEKNQENGQASDNALIEALKQMTIAQIRQVADTASAEELHFLMDG